MNALASSDFPLKPLAEETACLNIVSDAERWLGRVKKLMQVIEVAFCCVDGHNVVVNGL